MADSSNITLGVCIISASSAIIGVVVTQIITGYNNRKTESRRQNFEILISSLKRKIEVGEHFYAITGENLNLGKMLIDDNELLKTLKSDTSREYVNTVYSKISEDYQKFKSAKSIYSSVEIYYNVSSTYTQIANDAQTLKSFVAKIFEFNQQLSNAHTDAEKFEILPKAHAALDGYNLQLNTMVERMESDMKIVKSELLKTARLLNNG